MGTHSSTVIKPEISEIESIGETSTKSDVHRPPSPSPSSNIYDIVMKKKITLLLL